MSYITLIHVTVNPDQHSNPATKERVAEMEKKIIEKLAVAVSAAQEKDKYAVIATESDVNIKISQFEVIDP